MKALSFGEIKELCHRYDIPINGIFCRDQIPEYLQEGWYILNLDKSSGEGTHYTCFYYGNPSFYFDSFGFDAPQELSKVLKKYYYNEMKIQSLNSDSCGYFCMMIMKECCKTNTKAAFVNILSRFTNRADTNELILQQYFSNLKI